MSPSITVLKLLTGETIMCEIEYEKDERYVRIINPLIFDVVPKADGASMVVSKWLEAEQDSFLIKSWHIVTAAKPTEYMEDLYIESILDLEDSRQEDEDESDEPSTDFDEVIDRLDSLKTSNEVIH